MNGFGIELSGSFVLAAVAWVCAFGWVVFAAVALHGLAGRRPLPAARDSRAADVWPLVSVLMPARNEARRVLAESVRSVLAQDYERLEVVVVNDRSTDETGAILRSMAAADARLRVIDGAEPPDGWLGKPHALRQALEAARGEWVLTVDADMVLASEAVRVAVGRALDGGRDVLTLMPGLEAKTFWERVFTPVWVLVMLGAYPFALLNHPRTRQALAFGGFTLVRRAALESIGDFAAVRAEIVEDVRLAELLKRSGARYRIEHAPNLLRTRMQSGFREIWAFLTRGMFAGLGYSLLLSALYIFTGYVFVVAPCLVAVFGAPTIAAGAAGEWLRVLFAPSLVVWAVQVVSLALVCKNCGLPARYALTTPLGLALCYTALLVSIIDILRGEGVAWKERRVYGRAGVPLPTRRGRTTAPRKSA